LSAVTTADLSRPCWLTASGWQEFERIQQLGAESLFGFIAMWFDHSQDAVKLSIESATKDSGHVPIWIDQKEHVNRIDDEMIAQIRQSKFWWLTLQVKETTSILRRVSCSDLVAQ
jgi:hypothetical protein